MTPDTPVPLREALREAVEVERSEQINYCHLESHGDYPAIMAAERDLNAAMSHVDALLSQIPSDLEANDAE